MDNNQNTANRCCLGLGCNRVWPGHIDGWWCSGHGHRIRGDFTLEHRVPNWLSVWLHTDGWHRHHEWNGPGQDLLIAYVNIVQNSESMHKYQASDGMIYASMEIPKLFSIVNPQDDNSTEVNLDKDNYFMAAAGPLRPDMGPNKHRQANIASKIISIGSNGANGLIQSWLPLVVLVVMILFNVE